MDTDITHQQLGKYLLYERLGRGGMAEVWKALDTQLQRYVAIKILHADLQNDPEFSTRFLREAQVVASLRHPNIVQLYDFQITRYPEVEESVAYMVMDYIEGRNLADHIAATSRKRNFPPLEDIVSLFRAIGQAIDYAHQKGIIHRDIKPANILLDQRTATPHGIGSPILTDFGLVKLVSSPAVTLEGLWLGTPLYTSPEQAKGLPVNAQSDIYSLGVILYEICTGTRPFSGGTDSILRQHMKASPPAPDHINPAISPALREVILRSLAKDPQARFPTASSLATALAHAVNAPRLAQPTSISSLDTMRQRTHADQHAVPSMASRGVLLSSPTSPPSHVPAPLPQTERRAMRWRGKGLYTAILITLVTIFMGVSLGIGAFFWFPQQSISRAASAVASPIVGHAFFVSSGQLSGSGIPSINDELLIHLDNLRDPAPGKVYYGWLLRDKNQPLATPISLGMLPVKQGAVSLLFSGNPQHVNLLAITSRLLITEEDAGPPPMSPAPDFSTVRYYAELPQEPDMNDANHFSILDHLRFLLAQDPAVVGQQDRHSNLDIWLMEQTGRVLEWANSARDNWNEKNTRLMRPQFARILDYLDGDGDVQMDLPAGMVLPNIAPVALLGPPVPDIYVPLPADYLHQVSGHLNAIDQAPGVTSEQRTAIVHINIELNKVRNLLEQVHQDAKQLINMSDTQLLSLEAMSLMDHMVMQAFYAYTGQLDPPTGEVQGGVIEIHNEIERLTAFTVTAYAPGSVPGK